MENALKIGELQREYCCKNTQETYFVSVFFLMSSETNKGLNRHNHKKMFILQSMFKGVPRSCFLFKLIPLYQSKGALYWVP
jgi:hypothetical protein